MEYNGFDFARTIDLPDVFYSMHEIYYYKENQSLISICLLT